MVKLVDTADLKSASPRRVPVRVRARPPQPLIKENNLMDRFDVTFSSSPISIDYHFCREDDCFGTNDTHGYSFDEAKEVVVHKLRMRLEAWLNMSFEDWRRDMHPTEKEMDEDMDRAQGFYSPFAENTQ